MVKNGTVTCTGKRKGGRMKKYLAAGLAALVVLLCCGCSGSAQEQEAYVLYMRASEKMADADSMAMRMDMNMTMQLMGQTMEMDMGMDVQTVIHSPTDMDMAMQMTTEQMGASVEAAMYYTGGYYYMDMMGTRQKVAMDISEAAQQANRYNIQFQQAALKKAEVKEMNGGHELLLTLDGEVMNALMGQQLAGTTGEGDVQLQIGDVAMRAFIDGADNLKTMEMAFEMKMTVAGMEVECGVTMEMAYLQVGGVTVSFPADLDSYPLAA